MVEQVRLAGVLAEVRAADGHGDDLRAARLGRGARLLEIPVFAGTHDQAGVVFGAGDDQGRLGRAPVSPRRTALAVDS